MGKRISQFQIIVIAFFSIAIVLAVGIFALSRGGSSTARSNTTIWGTVDQNTIDKLIASIRQNSDPDLNVTYTQMRSETFEQNFVEALASGKGPDAIILSQDLILREKDKLLAFPYSSYSAADFKSTFLDEGQLFLDSNGIVAFPILVDPLVMYWNKSLFASAGVASPPADWENLIGIVPKLTKVLPNNNVVTQSGVALGEFSNITNAKSILSMLMLQAGSPIVATDSTGNLRSFLSDRAPGQALFPVQETLRFYTEFSNPLKPSYSWNRSIQESKKQFLANNLAIYFGFASELADIRAKNPNLNFDVARVPQSKTSSAAITFGRLQGLAIVRTTSNVQNTFSNIVSLISADAIKELSESTNLPPVRRDLLSQQVSDNSFLDIFYRSALIARAWLDPNPTKTAGIFQDMVESVTSGRAELSSAVDQANSDMQNLIK